MTRRTALLTFLVCAACGSSLGSRAGEIPRAFGPLPAPIPAPAAAAGSAQLSPQLSAQSSTGLPAQLSARLLAPHRTGRLFLEAEGERSVRPRSARDVWDDARSAVKNNGSDFAYIYTAPVRINGRSALWLGGILAVGGILYAYDQDIYDALKRNEFEEPYRWVRDTGEFFEPVGYQGAINKYLLGGVAVGYVTGFEPLTTFSSDILRSFLISAPGKSAANEAFGRRGPKLGQGPRSFVFGDGRSFPSGHSLAIATVARVITYRIRVWPIQAVAYTMMGTVLLQRVTSSAHWPSDAYFGGLYGWFVTDALLQRRDARGLAIAPILPAEGRNAGLGVRLRW